VVALNGSDSHKRVAALRECVSDEVFKLANLVATASETGTVIALHPQAWSTEPLGQPVHRVQRRRQEGKRETGVPIEGWDACIALTCTAHARMRSGGGNIDH
jgi:hypothetical protein